MSPSTNMQPPFSKPNYSAYDKEPEISNLLAAGNSNIIATYKVIPNFDDNTAQPTPTMMNPSRSDLFSPADEDYDMVGGEDSATQSTVTSPATVGNEGWKRPRQDEDDDYDD